MKTRLKIHPEHTLARPVVVVLTCFLVLGVTSLRAGLDDLLSRSGDAAFDEFPETPRRNRCRPDGFENRRVPRSGTLHEALIPAADLTTAQPPVRQPPDLRWVDNPESHVGNALPFTHAASSRRAGWPEHANRIGPARSRSNWGLRPPSDRTGAPNPTTVEPLTPAFHTITLPVYMQPLSRGTAGSRETTLLDRSPQTRNIPPKQPE